MVAVTAVMSVVLIGATALAVDLSVNTQAKRSLQNITDPAALAGARDLPSNPKQALKDALDVLQRNSPWSSSSTWLSTAQSAITGTCSSASGSTCTVTVAGPTGYTNYTATLSSPPSTPSNSSYSSTDYLEVDLSQSSTNAFGVVVGEGSSSEKGHSIAYYAGPTGPYEYAFFAKKQAGSGNSDENVVGDAYVGGGYTPQSNGKASFCVLELSGPESSSQDTDGDTGGGQDNDQDDQGHVVFSGVPPTVGSDATYGNGGSCPSGKGNLSAQAPTPTTSANCPANATAQSYVSNGTTYYACVQSPPPVPDIPEPTGATTPTGSTSRLALSCPSNAATVNSSTGAGVYVVPANCVVTLDFSGGNINCVSLDLRSGASVQVNDKKSNDYISSYGFDPTNDSLARSALSNAGITAPTTACGGSGNNTNRSVIWAADPGGSSYPTALSNSTTGCCSDSIFLGTVFLPGQTISFNSNQAMEVVGEAYCGDWEVQSGDHPNPTVTYDSNGAAYVVSTLRLAE